MAKDLAITPAKPNTTENLTATYTYFDPDGDPENKTLTEIRWYRNGALVPELNNTLIVPSNYTLKGEIWYFTVKPSDGTTYGDIYKSPSVKIQNTPPQIITITITPDPAYTNSTLNATITSYDADNDTITFTYQWQKYNETEGTWQDIPGATNQTLGPENFNKGDKIKVICTPYDGEEYGESQEAIITISNAPPEILSHYPSEKNITINKGDTQDFNVTCIDIDGDILTIEWYINGTLQQEWTGNTSVTFQPDQAGVYTITVVVSDGQEPTSHDWLLTVEEQS
jgi:membrane carboxypeptidase/penicillin-binding protein PbpC